MKRIRNLILLSTLAMMGTCVPARCAFCRVDAAKEQQSRIKRLILNDGSFELISEYEVQGDRVRYFSSERNTWEELPYSMVDWTATEQYARQSAREANERRNAARAKASEEKETRNPTVAPGLRLPSFDGAFLLDVYESKSVLSPLEQSGADLYKNTGSNILRGAINPVAGPKQTIELKELHARVQSHVPAPAIYLSIDPGDPSIGYNSESAKDHLRLIRCENKKGNRVVVRINIAIYGKVKQSALYVETRVEAVSEFWVRVTPAAPLQPGEYALVEFDDKGAMNQFVWDFGVNPSAPPNPVLTNFEPQKTEPVLIQKQRKNADPQ